MTAFHLFPSIPMPSPAWWLCMGLFALVFLGISGGISTHWRMFARRYPGRQRPPGKAYTSPMAWFGKNSSASYRGMVVVVFCEAGIYFRVFWFFRTFHPPFLLPWESVKGIYPHPYRSFWVMSGYELGIIDEAGGIRMWLPLKAGADLERFCPGGIEARRAGKEMLPRQGDWSAD